MMKNNKWTYLRLVVVMFSVMTVGCSTYGKISALPADNQELRIVRTITVLLVSGLSFVGRVENSGGTARLFHPTCVHH
jgi:hypothetical protein